MFWLKVEPPFQPLHGDSRWRPMLDKVGFPGEKCHGSVKNYCSCLSVMPGYRPFSKSLSTLQPFNP
jgi:hypothetical protein